MSSWYILYDNFVYFWSFHLFLRTNGNEPGQGPQWVIKPSHSGLKRQTAGQKSKNENLFYVFSAIESCKVGIPAYYAKVEGNLSFIPEEVW